MTVCGYAPYQKRGLEFYPLQVALQQSKKKKNLLIIPLSYPSMVV